MSPPAMWASSPMSQRTMRMIPMIASIVGGGFDRRIAECEVGGRKKYDEYFKGFDSPS
jgi:hypothetical protein